MQALILAGGLGMRLRPVVFDRPKPMAPVAGVPFLERLLGWLGRQGVTEVVLCVGYRWEAIRAALGEGARWGVSIRYSVEETPLGTAGALKHAEPLAAETFFVLNGDTFVDVHLPALAAFHRQKQALGTLTLVEVEDARPYGTVHADPSGRLQAFAEKNTAASPSKGWVNAGLYRFERALLHWIPGSRPVSLERETLPALARAGEALYGYFHQGYFIDIGTPEHYAKSQEELKERL